MVRLCIAAVVLTCFGGTMLGQAGDPHSWSSVRRLAPGQRIEVVSQRGKPLKGTLESVSEESIAVQVKGGTVAVPRSGVSRVRIRPDRGRKYALIGAAIGAGVGVGLGAAGGDSLAETSGGDFAGLKPLAMGAGGAVGALVGAITGSLLGNHGTTIYRAK